jgi:transcriptional regulator with XRE-family HTH domain
MISATECASRNVAFATARALRDLAKEYFKTMPTINTAAPADVDPAVVSGQIDPARKQLADAVTAYRLQHSMTLSDLAQALDMSKGHLYRVTSATGAVSESMLERVRAFISRPPAVRQTGRGYSRRRNAAPPAAAPVTETPAPVATATPAPPAPSVREMAAVFLRTTDDIRSALTLDGVTPHYFARTVDDSIIVLRPKA